MTAARSKVMARLVLRSQVKYGEVKMPWLGTPYRAAGAGDSSGPAVFRPEFGASVKVSRSMRKPNRSRRAFAGTWS